MTRFERYDPPPGTDAYQQGKDQAEIALHRFHILRACIEKKYTVVDVPPVLTKCQIFPVQGLEFSKYKDFEIKPTGGMKLRPQPDGTIEEEVLQSCHDYCRNYWKTSEGGILYDIGEGKNFYAPVLNYHSHAGTTGSDEWDRLFKALKEKNFAKCLIPCMFFARHSGCLDASCPFLHDATRTRAVREELLAKRYKEMQEVPQCLLHPDGRKWKGEHADRTPPPGLSTANVKAVCANRACLKPWYGTDSEVPLKACSRCKWTNYCSAACQKKDWKRHKAEPCAPVEEIVENDDLWSPIGTRKGTEWISINWGRA